ncbi:leucine-rich repeat domain-containing protein [Bacteroides caecigallinarum]|uniref:leucine-rich repeat domain-containing protein n=1 Tax=Bacteroides caecigallinarum TaxID=1411144 RepID=UPI001F271982|nr:leucine-rich repeat domain-containing protein [Bacteroides caecigallinarum]MCF2580726.1 leucine-rich repeat domain-containing protein [Bacteroides caecigallinarum]
MKTMKHLFGALPLVALALSFTACGNDETFGEPETTPAGNQVTMTFTANAPAPAAGTRTSLQPGDEQGSHAVYWTPDDVIGVYSCTSEEFYVEEPGSPFTTDLSAAAPTATFTGTAEADALQYIAVYPRDMFAGCEWSSAMTMLGFTLPTVQTAEAGGFDTGLNPSWAMTADMGGDLSFQNLCALVKFSISCGNADELESVTLTDLGGTGLSGTAQYGYTPSMEMVMAAVPYVTLTGSFTTGTDYYFVVAPSVNTDSGQPAALKNGFSLTFTRRDGTSFTKTASGGIGDTNLASGMILDLGTIDLSGATYQEAITNPAFINAVGNQVGWEVTGGGGTVLLTEENKKAIEAVTSLNIEGKNLTDISGIEYFTNLTSLSCGDNQLTALPVEKLTNLTNLYCSDNQLTALPVENLTNLTLLYCSNNQLTALLVEKLSKLTNLRCNDNQLTALPVENLSQLTELSCSYNQLTELPVGNLTELTVLNCDNNQLTALPVENLTVLEQLNCGTNLLTELDIEKLTQLKNLNCGDNQLTALSVGSLTNLAVLDCSENRLTELDIRNLNLNSLYCGNQTDAAGEPQNLKLILTSAQETKWNNMWKNWSYNERVTVEVKDLGSTAHW